MISWAPETAINLWLDVALSHPYSQQGSTLTAVGL